MGLTPEEVQKRLDPKHLTTAEDLKEDVEKRAQKALAKEEEKAQEKESTDPRAEREYTFDFSWTDGRGKVWTGKFTNRVPDIRTRQLIGALRSQLGNNIPFEALDPLTREMNLVVAHLSFSLIKRPKWANDLTELFNFELLQAIYTEVANHEAMFLGYGPAATEG